MSRIDRLLAQIEHPGCFDEAWTHLFQGPLQLGMGQAIVAIYTILPRVVDAAERQEPTTLWEFWHQLGNIVANLNYNRDPEPIPAHLEAPFRAALVQAEALALRSFAAKEWGNDASDLALACLALSHHPVGCLVWQGPRPPDHDDYGPDFARIFCRKCGAEDIMFAIVGDGVAADLDWEKPQRVPDLQQPSLEAPPAPDLSAHQRPSHPWGAIAAALDKPAGELSTLCSHTPFPKDFLDRFGEYVEIAAAVAKAGVPKESPNRAVLSLFGVMVALSGAFPWAGQLLRLAGFVRCPDCGAVDSWDNCLVNIG